MIRLFIIFLLIVAPLSDAAACCVRGHVYRADTGAPEPGVVIDLFRCHSALLVSRLTPWALVGQALALAA